MWELMKNNYTNESGDEQMKCKYSIGDKVRLNLEKVDEKHKKYKDVYTIKDIRTTYDEVII